MKNALVLSTALTASALLATTVNAGETPLVTFDGDSCNVEFNNDVSLAPGSMEIMTRDNHQMRFDGQNLYIDGDLVTLTSSQTQALQNYSDGLRAQLPEVANIALEGVKIAGVALDEVTNAFGISDSTAISDLMDNLHNEVQQAFYQEGNFVIGRQRFEEFDNTFDDKIEAQIEDAMESAMMESIGSILMAIGSEMISSGGNMSDFEQRMERMGEQIEEKVELQAKQLEQRAEKLCDSFTLLAQNEQQLHTQVPELTPYQLFQQK